MRLTNRRKQRTNLELSMTSMIDVVFLLLIFFIVATTFVRPERQILSAIKVNEKGDTAVTHLEPAIVEITRSGEQSIFQIGAIRTNDLTEIKKVLEQFENKSDGAFVRAAGNVPFESAAQAIGACKASGFAAVSYLPGE